MGLLQSKSDRCATLGIYIEGRAAFAIVAEKLSSTSFSRLTEMALINIEPGWAREHAHTLNPTPDFIRIGDPAMRHLRLVGFGLSMRYNWSFRHIAILVLGDLDDASAPTMADLYGVLLEATWLEALSGVIVCLIGSSALLRAPTLDKLDVRLMDERDCSSLLGCADLVRPVKALRIYGFKWSKVESLRLRNPRTESIHGILAALAVGNLRIHYPFPAKNMSRTEMNWVSTKVDTVVLTVEWEQAWYATAR
ncbi:hypothetical protein B0H14DRAFT_2633948 [Mycena olivaceomarginata]|nr:hypothetical protein B0H14DRAFT_2633948 [Mycena olivaceomarginata]